jgi:hypothetical protein
MKNLKTAMIAVMLMLAAVGGVVAQEKWEYAIVKQFITKKTVYISIGGQAVKEQTVSTNCDSDCNGLLLLIQQMTSEAWEVINADRDANCYLYFLKRKIKA